jgi:predicted permease
MLARQQEIAVRRVLGAGGVRLVSQLLSESFVLALVGGGVGIFAGFGIVRVLSGVLPPDLLGKTSITLNTRLLMFLVLIVPVCALASGAIPAYLYSRGNVRELLMNNLAQATVSRRGRYFRNTLVALEVALAAILLVAGALTGNSFWNIRHKPLGFASDDVWTASVRPSRAQYRSDIQRRTIYQTLTNALAERPGIEAVSMASGVPLVNSFDGMQRVSVASSQISGAEGTFAFTTHVTNGFFQTLNIGLTAGRPFNDDEPAVVVNQAFVKRYFRTNPLGQMIRLSDSPWLTIVGVVGDVSMTFGPEIPPQVFRPCGDCTVLLVKGTSEYIARASIDAVLPLMGTGSALEESQSLDRALANVKLVTEFRSRFALFATCAGIGLLMALGGVYSVVRYSVRRRWREIGVLSALGATRGQIVLRIMKDSMAPIIVGVFGGLCAAAVLSDVMKGYLFEITPLEPSVFAFVSVLLLAVAAAASVPEMWRGACANPVVCLRCDE